MDVFKTKPYICECLLINESTFANATRGKDPYVQIVGEDKISYYAVCPECDNPIQIIGLYRVEQDATQKPYGRHYGKSIEKLARYNETAYHMCSYAKRKHRLINNLKRKPRDPTSFALYNTMMDNFDRIIYCLSKAIDIHISLAFARERLVSWIANEGWRYYDVSYYNLPFALMWAEGSFPLLGRYIKKDSDLHRVLMQSNLPLEFKPTNLNNYVQVKNTNGQFVRLSFHVAIHKLEMRNEHLYETIQLRIYNDEKHLMEKIIEIDHNFISHIMQMESWKPNEELLAVAKEFKG